MEKDDIANNVTENQKEQSLSETAVRLDLKSSVLGKIEAKEVHPTAKWVFSGMEYALWSAWFFTVLFGALSVSVTLYVIDHQRYALYELTHQNFATFVFDVLPDLWLVLFVVMSALAVFNMRHTKRGYRYPLWQIIGSSIVVSLVLGFILHVANAGFSLDKQIGAWSKNYPSQERLELRWWQNPKEGRLVGSAMYIRDGGDTVLRFIDESGVMWQFEMDELRESEKNLLNTGQKVRVFGAVTEETSMFHACGAMPWVQGRSYAREELDEIRQEAREKIMSFKQDKPLELAPNSVCGQILRRLPKPPVEI